MMRHEKHSSSRVNDKPGNYSTKFRFTKLCMSVCWGTILPTSFSSFKWPDATGLKGVVDIAQHTALNRRIENVD